MKKLLLLIFLIGTGYFRVSAQDQAQYKMDSLMNLKVRSLIDGRSWVKFSSGVMYDGKSKVYTFNSSDETIYEIASITKTFFSLILAHAILEKRVRPDDDIRKYLKGNFDNLQFHGHPIALIQLVNLTSSLPDNFPPSSDFLTELHKAKLDTMPGLLPRHSNVAAVLLGQILQNIYHKTYSILLKEYITGPLKMEHTFFDIPAGCRKDFPNGYNWKGAVMPFVPTAASTAGGLHSTVADMTTYLQYQLDEKDSAVKLTHEAQWGDINDFAIGMNWFLGKTGDGKKFVHDDGTTYGFTSYFLLYPETHFGIILLSNEYDAVSNNSLGNLAQEIFNEMTYTAAERASDGFGFSSSVNELLTALQRTGFALAQPVYDSLKSKNTGFGIRENEMNNWGYSLLFKGKKQEALNILKLNVALYPDSWNVYDSYGETLLAMGQREEGLKMYRKSVELNPGNENAKKVLQTH